MIIDLEYKNCKCTMCGTKFQQWIHSNEEDCPLCRIATSLDRLCELVELR